jgi:peptide/nickel transport system substrate-binding protein
MTAEDVVFSLDRARAEDSTNAQKPLFAGIESVEAVDDTTVVVTLTAPDGAFPFKMAWGDAVIVDPASAETNATNPVGTGPFRFSEWVQGDRVEIVRNDDYWGEPVALEAATFQFISDPNAAFAAMMSGDIDAFPNFPAPETLAQFEANPQFNVVVGSTEGETILAMNNAGEPLNDVRIRQAITHAINRQDIIDGAMFGYGTPIGTHFAPHNPDYVDLTGNSAYDPDAARALLAEAGVEDLTLRLMLPPPSYARRGGEIIAAQLREVGIETEITNMEWADWLEQVFRGKDFDLTIVSHTEPFDINIYANPEYYFQYDNPDFQALNAALEVESDPAERSALLAQMQTMISEDYVNGYLFQLAKTGVANAGIEGLWENSPDAGQRPDRRALDPVSNCGPPGIRAGDAEHGPRRRQSCPPDRATASSPRSSSAFWPCFCSTSWGSSSSTCRHSYGAAELSAWRNLFGLIPGLIALVFHAQLA